MKRSDFIFNILLLPVDFMMLILAGISTYFLRTEIISGLRPVFFRINLPFEKYLLLVIATAGVFIICYAISGLYSMRSSRRFGEEFLKIIVASSAGIMGIIIYIFLRQELLNSRFLVLGGWVTGIIFVSIGRFVVNRLKKFLVSRYDFGVHKIMVIGNDDVTEKVKEFVEYEPSIGYRLVKHLVNPDIEEVKLAVGNPGIDEVILANPNYSQDQVLQLVDFCHENHIAFKFVPNLFQTLTTNTVLDDFAGLPMVELRRTALDGWGRVTKRATDVFISAMGLITLSPVLGFIAFAIKWETEGSVLARLERVSQNQRFRLLKFRSMIKDADRLKPLLADFNERSNTPLFKMRNDPRLTKVGRFIRKFRLDELPQLINVLKGEISLIGPRPHEPQEIARYQKHHKRVLAMKAGASGLAQVSGASDLDFEEEVALDTYYIEHWSLWLDIKIIFRTIGKMFFDRSAV